MPLLLESAVQLVSAAAGLTAEETSFRRAFTMPILKKRKLQKKED